MREELRGPVVRFRKFVDTVGREAPSEAEAFDEYLDELVRTEVDPALSELDELVHQDVYLWRLADGATKADHWIPAVSSVILGVGGLSGAASIISAVAGVASAPLRGLYKHIAAERHRRSHPLYLLHQLGQHYRMPARRFLDALCGATVHGGEATPLLRATRGARTAGGVTLVYREGMDPASDAPTSERPTKRLRGARSSSCGMSQGAGGTRSPSSTPSRKWANR
jgi:hypothetical protein